MTEKASGTFAKGYLQATTASRCANDPSPAGDISFIFAHMKMLDPASVVREGSSPRHVKTLEAFHVYSELIWNKAVQGTKTHARTENGLHQPNKTSSYQSALKQQRQVDQTFEERSRQFGVPSSLVVRGQSSYLDTSTQPTPSVLPPEKQRDFDELKGLTPDNFPTSEIMGILGFSSVGDT